MTRFLGLLIAALVFAAVFTLTSRPPPAVHVEVSQAAAQGARCERNSECASPLVCEVSQGRCMVECLNNRDCRTGTHCVMSQPGVGACVMDQGYAAPGAAYCVASRDCSSGACQANQCGG